MNTTTQGILDAALQLSEEERVQVVQELLGSLGPGLEQFLDDAWTAELDRRAAEFQEGQADAVEWSELVKQR